MRKNTLGFAGGMVFGVSIIILYSACTPFNLSLFGLGIALIVLALRFFDKAKTVA